MVIPEEIRNTLGLNEGDEFVVIGEGDAVNLKAITPPKIDEFHGLLSQARLGSEKSWRQEGGVENCDCQSQAQREVKMKAILDTDVFISGGFWKCPPFEILKAWQEQRFRLAVSPPILDEYRRVVDERACAAFTQLDLQVDRASLGMT